MSDILDDKDNTGFIATEVLDHKERKALEEKARAEAKASKQKIPVDEIEATLSRSRLAAEKRKQRMNVMKLAVAGVVLCFLGWFTYYLFAPYKGGKPYGICRTFLEMNVQFPQDLRLSSMEKFEDSIRIWFLQVDAFGEYRMENIQCYYKMDEQRGLMIDKISINRREVDPEKVKAFNNILPAVSQMPLDLAYPAPFPSSLDGLHFDSDRYRKRIF